MSSIQRTTILRKKPIFERPRVAAFQFRDPVGDRIQANLEGWLLTAPGANPAMLQMFRDQDRQPSRDLLPWSGEFVGKYLISAIQGWRITRDERLRVLIDEVVGQLIDSQLPDGYLGPFVPEVRLTSDRWDVWGHYHWMQAFLMYHEDTASRPALDACSKAGQLIHRTFVGSNRRMQSPEQNLAILHGACLLYERTGEPEYLELAEWVIRELDHPESCGYIEDALAGKPIQEFRARRWEGLHCIQGLCELGFITGDPQYHEAFRHIWWEMLKGDRHNTGGFTSDEACQGNPYHQGAIETCCTVAWIALTIDMLRLTGNALVADELEFSTLNAILGAQHPSGRWWTYDTPMDGQRRASAHDIMFQARPGSPELNCCSVNGPRGLGMLSEWAVMTAEDGAVLNYYGPGSITVSLPSGQALTLTQATRYPLDGSVRISLDLEQPDEFALYVRIPGWSRESTLAIDGEQAGDLSPGSYARFHRAWSSGDTIELQLDMSLHCWTGEKELAGKTSLYHGPLLLTYDRYFNTMDPDAIPPLSTKDLSAEFIATEAWLKPWLLLKLHGTDGRELNLCDYASAGASGTPYRSWLPVKGAIPVDFTHENPRRAWRP